MFYDYLLGADGLEGLAQLAFRAMDDVGFGRAEMGSERLAGTVKGCQRHVFLTWGRAEAWPEDPFDQKHKGSLPVALDDAIGKAKKEINGKVRLSLVEQSGGEKEPNALQSRL